MPFYEYACKKCGEIFDVLQKLGAGAEGVLCPRCGGSGCDKLMSVAAVRSDTSGGTATSPGGCVPRGGFS